MKRLAMPKTWPFARKGRVYVVSPLPGRNLEKCLPLALVIKHLGIARTTKEVKFILNAGKVLVNNKIIREKSFPIGLFDVISLPSAKKNFRLLFKNKKLFLLPIDEEDAKIKPVKVIKKTSLKGKKLQINLDDGANLLSSVQCKVGDTLVVNLDKKTSVSNISFEKGCIIYLLGGKYLGESAKVIEIKGTEIICEILSKEKSKEAKKTSVLKKHILVIGKEKPVITLLENE